MARRQLHREDPRVRYPNRHRRVSDGGKGHGARHWPLARRSAAMAQ